jgi:hypothetical protein
MGVPRQVAGQGDTKIAVLLHILQLYSCHEVRMRLADAPGTDVHDVTFLRVEVHLPARSPLLQSVDVMLENVTVSGGVDGAIDDTVVSKPGKTAVIMPMGVNTLYTTYT